MHPSQKGIQIQKDPEQNAQASRIKFHRYRSKILEATGLLVDYSEGNGNWVKAESGEWVLDTVNGYGVNIWGHNPSELISHFTESLNSTRPNTIQVSRQSFIDNFRNSFSRHFICEDDENTWELIFSNSGTESVEVALKICLLKHKEYKREIQQFLNHKFNQAFKEAEFLNSLDLKEEIESMYITAMHLIDSPTTLAYLEGAYHGKTLGSLSITSNHDFQIEQGLTVVEIPKSKTPHGIELLKAQFESISYPIVNNGDLAATSISFCKLAGLIIEPIQGESGYHSISTNVIEFARQKDVTIVADEIQTGLYRTGSFLACEQLGIKADIYCLAKGLGGGLSKLALTVCQQAKMPALFDVTHTSTFAENRISIDVATKNLDMLFEKREQIQNNIEHIRHLLTQGLNKIENQFPAVIKETRVHGVFAGIEFDPSYLDFAYEMKMLIGSDLYGYILSSCLLFHEKVRILPTLSSPNTLRFSCSLLTQAKDIQFFLQALENLCSEIFKKNFTYLLRPIFPKSELGTLKEQENPIRPHKVDKKIYFLCHYISTEHARHVFPLLKNISDGEIESKLENLFHVFRFFTIDTDYIELESGETVEIQYKSFPITSKMLLGLKEGDRLVMIEKIQDVVDQAAREGVNAVGLGQFTSIVTRSGLRLTSSENVTITTGNSYTTSLGLASLIKASRETGKGIENSHVCIVGFCGNISHCVTKALVKNCKGLHLIHHTSIEDSPKFQYNLNQLLIFLKTIKDPSPLVDQINKVVERYSGNFNKIIEELEKKKLITTSASFAPIESDIIVNATNSSKRYITRDKVKKNAIILDLSVPNNLSEDIQERDDLTIILGGIAKWPDQSQQDFGRRFHGIVLGENEAFGCISETIILSTLENYNSKRYIGEISLENIEKIEAMAKITGFKVKREKLIGESSL
jgi:acetylornithine/succinyldiaminopimelate/putrescine aminotransferase/predicted amino acid dehydrogenase